MLLFLDMCGLKGEDQGQSSQTIHQSFQDQLLFQQMHQQQQHQQQQTTSDIYGEGGGLMFPEVSPILPWTSLSQVHSFNPVQYTANPVRDHDMFLLPPPPHHPPSSSYGGLVNRRAPLRFAYDHHHHGPSDHLRIITDTFGPVVQSGSTHFGLQSELGKMTAQEIMDAKALAASKSHSEAERRRRERINNHLAKLRSLLPSTTKVSQ